MFSEYDCAIFALAKLTIRVLACFRNLSVDLILDELK